MNPNSMTYEDLRDHARRESERLGRYAAVVEITTYRSSNVRRTVMVSMTPICHRARGAEFVGVGVQFHNGRPYRDPRDRKPARPLVNIGDYEAPEGMPF